MPNCPDSPEPCPDGINQTSGLRFHSQLSELTSLPSVKDLLQLNRTSHSTIKLRWRFRLVIAIWIGYFLCIKQIGSPFIFEGSAANRTTLWTAGLAPDHTLASRISRKWRTHDDGTPVSPVVYQKSAKFQPCLVSQKSTISNSKKFVWQQRIS